MMMSPARELQGFSFSGAIAVNIISELTP